MTLLNKQDLMSLARIEGPCVSIYLPTHEAGPDTEQDGIRLKNLLGSADSQLQALGVQRSERDALLEPAWSLTNDYDFWQHQKAGLAVLLAKGSDWIRRLPQPFLELVIVGDRFHLKPLLPLLTEGGRFYVLALSQGRVRLLEASPHSINELELGDAVPASLEQALGHDWQQRSLQLHSQRRNARARSEAIFHGHGAGTDDHETELRRFLEILDGGLSELLAGERRPIVLAGVEEITALFRKMASYSPIAERTISGNCDDVPARELHERAWKVVEPIFRSQQMDAIERYRELSGTDKVSDDLDEILPAAHDGRVDTLFVGIGRQVWGRYDDARRTVERGQGEGAFGGDSKTAAPGEDLLDLTALRGLETGANVYALEPEQIPGKKEAAAIFRY